MPFPGNRAARLALACLLALAIWDALWELLLAPVRIGSGWLALKALPLLFLWHGAARGSRRTRQWAVLVIPWYFAEALTRALSERGRHAAVAGVAAVLAGASFAAFLAWFRASRRVADPGT